MEVLRSYSSHPEIKRLEEFSSNSGFLSFHLQWPIGRLKSWLKHSSVYEAGKVGSMRSAQGATYNFSVQYLHENNTLQITLCGYDKSADYSALPLMARGMVRGREEESYSQYVWGESTLTSSCISNAIIWNFPIDLKTETETEEETVPIIRYEFHCWLDVPSNPQKPQHIESLSGCYGTELLSSDFANLFSEVIKDEQSEDDRSDVVLITKQEGVEHRFFGHRLILGARSTVFKTMFAGDNFKDARQGAIEIEDIDSAAMKEVLRYIYTGKFDPLSPFMRTDNSVVIIQEEKANIKKMLTQLMNAAEKYALPELMDECIYNYMRWYKMDEDRVDLLQCAELFRLDWVKNLCVMTLSTNMDLFKDETMRDKLSKDALGSLVAMCAARARDTKSIELSTK